jgi:prepilin-type N-terminal cleavage/methylation domain-containing protein
MEFKFSKSLKKELGFTLIELLVVISIIGFLASAAVVALNSARMKARDARRLADMAQIQKALDLYYQDNSQYPGNTDNDCSGWDTGYYGSGDIFISPLKIAQLINEVPGDPTSTSQCGGYRYYRYGAGSYGCNPSQGAFYVLGISNMEASASPHAFSPGWSCPSRNWQGEFYWVTGKFEK